MTSTAMSVRKSITVEAPQEKAFRVFTTEFASWWPLDTHHIGEKEAVDAVIEPRAGGRWYERAADGTECEWGTVIAFEPPERVIFGWQLNAAWKYDPDFVTEVEVLFIAEGDARTRVELEHRDLERYGERQTDLIAAIDSDGGWPGLLRRFAEAVTA